jgi:hypothetical protein
MRTWTRTWQQAAAGVAAAVAVVAAPGAAAGQAAPAAGDSARRAVGEIRTRADAFRDTVNAQIGDLGFDYGRPRRGAAARRFVGGLTLSVSQPVGEFRRFARPGFGLSLNGVAGIDQQSVLGLRAEGGGTNYGRFSAPFQQQGFLIGIPARQETSNNIYWGAIGPQVTLPLGPVRPYAYATVGVANFTTTSRLFGADVNGNRQTFWQATDLWNLSLMHGLGGGTRVQLARQDGTPVSLDLGARRHYVGSARYLAPGAVPGQTAFNNLARTGRADFWTYHVGFSVGGR